MPSKSSDALRWLRSVADAVAERPDGVDRAAALGVAEDSLKRDKIGVNVRHDEGTGHRGEYSEWALV